MNWLAKWSIGHSNNNSLHPVSIDVNGAAQSLLELRPVFAVFLHDATQGLGNLKESELEQMQAGQLDRTHSSFRRRFTDVQPHVYQDGDSVSLQFKIGEIQSQMRLSDPNLLVLSYTRAMISFLIEKRPASIALIGLGGGSIAKWCYHNLPATDITVIEISPTVISLRDQFFIPEDNHRFRVVCADGADFVASTEDSPQVLLVDGFDMHGQPPQLCSQVFYEDCYRALAPDGLMVVNLCGPEDQQAVDRIQRVFENRVLIIIPEDGENKVVFAGKGRRLWIEDNASVWNPQRNQTPTKAFSTVAE
jgi:spermidine synthase